MENFLTLGMLVLLQAVLGFDNLLYISLETKQVEKEKQASVRNLGIGLAIALRIVLLFALIHLIKLFQDPLFSFHFGDNTHGTVNGHSLIVFGGGAFILYTAVKEIWHMMLIEEHEESEVKKKSAAQAIIWIVVMNVIFSFDSILGAMALTDVTWVMVTAIVISGVLMIWLSGKVSTFLAKNRMYEVLGLFVLFLVGVMLISEGGHLAHITLFSSAITPMSKGTFYFVIFVLVAIDIVQGRYQKKILAQKERNKLNSKH